MPSTAIGPWDIEPPADAVASTLRRFRRIAARAEIDITALVAPKRIRITFGHVPLVPGENYRAAAYTYSRRHFRFRHMPNIADPSPALMAMALFHETFHTLRLTSTQKAELMAEMVPLPTFDPADLASVWTAWAEGDYKARGCEVAADSFVAAATDIGRFQGGRYYGRHIPDARLFRVLEIIRATPADAPDIPEGLGTPEPLPPEEPPVPVDPCAEVAAALAIAEAKIAAAQAALDGD